MEGRNLRIQQPRQRLPYNKKDKDWRKSNLDYSDKYSFYHDDSVRRTFKNKIINLIDMNADKLIKKDIKPNNNNPNPICCEIQVRTLFEEIWGEIDHSINYPHPTDSVACKEQLRVLSKLVGTGTRLADSIFRTLNDQK